ncbi:MAG TPA: Gfo/Idh/MocA family oxidoreductase [Polyangiaceae bacterium]|nr:Gfo/Idh/MocA family oxidoreductase [Polyangiaceae bacterium]
MIGIGVIGYGYWGPNLVRNFSQAEGSRVVAVCDPRTDRRKHAVSTYPAITAVETVPELLANPAVDAVAIATPVSTHFDLAMQALQAGKHVMVEKPMTSNSDQARRLIDEADKRNRVLLVDHTFVYTSVVRKIKELVDSQQLGKLYYYDSVRVNLGLFQHDVNVLWDLAVHDLSIMDFVLGRPPQMVAATGVASVPGHPESLAYLTCFFDNDLIAHFHVNWLAPVKIRSTMIGGSDKMILWDDMELSEKLRVYDKGITLNSGPEGVYQLKVGYRAGDMWAPHVPNVEALQDEAKHFIRCINDNRTPLTDGRAGLRVVKILEAASQSMAEHGKPVRLTIEE